LATKLYMRQTIPLGNSLLGGTYPNALPSDVSTTVCALTTRLGI